MKHYLSLYIATLVVMSVLDLLWIGGIARNFYKNNISNIEFHAIPAVVFYLIYVAGVVFFVSGKAPDWQATLLYGALFGFFCYATYDLTNLATLRGWSLVLSLVDMAWGTLITSVASTAGFLFTQWLER